MMKTLKALSLYKVVLGVVEKKISSYKLDSYLEPARPAGTFITHDKQTDTKESLRMNANIGIGYRVLAKVNMLMLVLMRSMTMCLKVAISVLVAV